MPPMKTPRSHFSLVALDGVIYALGGLSENAEAREFIHYVVDRLLSIYILFS